MLQPWCRDCAATRTFSRTLAPGRMFVIWYERAMPLREMTWGGSPATFSPSRRMRPLVGRSTPVTQLKKVLFPAPLGPMMARICPRGTVTLTRLTALKPPNRMVTSSVRRIGDSAAPRPPSVGRAAGAPGAGACSDATLLLRELAVGREDRLLLRNHLEDAVLVVLDV